MSAARFGGAFPEERGFTLMEVLIAVTITSVIGLGVWQVISSVMNSRDRVDQVAEDFDGLQKTMLLLERDITQLVNRPARDVYGDFSPSLTTRDDAFVLMLTRQGWRNPLGLRRSGLQRVGWEFTGTELRRRYWPVVDQGQEDESIDILLLDSVLEFEVRFLDREGKWQEEWPGENVMAQLMPGARPDIALPRGIEVTLEHERFGEMTRTFSLPDFETSQAQAIINRQQESGDESDEEPDESGDRSGAGSAQE